MKLQQEACKLVIIVSYVINCHVTGNVIKRYADTNSFETTTTVDPPSRIQGMRLGPHPYLVWKRFRELSKTDNNLTTNSPHSGIPYLHKSLRFLYPQAGGNGTRFHFVLSNIQANMGGRRTSEVVIEPQPLARGDPSINCLIRYQHEQLGVSHTDEGYVTNVTAQVNNALVSNTDGVTFDIQMNISNYFVTLIITEVDIPFTNVRKRRSVTLPPTTVSCCESTSPRPTPQSQAPRVCGLMPWRVNFTFMGWDWVIEPYSFDANICVGFCPSSLNENFLNTTNYAFIKNHYHVITGFSDRAIPKACCVPIEYMALSILLIDDGTPVAHQYGDMRAKRCGCR